MKDYSDEEEPDEDRPFLTGTYLGTIQSADGSKQYTTREGTIGPNNDLTRGPDGLVGGETIHSVAFKLYSDQRQDRMRERRSCDEIGEYVMKGRVEGTRISYQIEYEVGLHLELRGEWCGRNDKFAFEGDWEATGATGELARVGLETSSSGRFRFEKRIREDE